MAAWMLWATLVASLLGLAAHCAERASAVAGRATRLPWLAALAATVALTLWRFVDPPVGASSSTAGSSVPVVVDSSWSDALTLVSASSFADRLDPLLGASWAIAAIVLTLSLVGGLVTLTRRARAWTRSDVDGEPVLVSSDFGPALVGVAAPAIVLPRWLFALPRSDVRLAVAHEAEHRSAGDAWLLLAGALAVTAMPWNVGLWWQLARLRAAVEVDCDRRVLRRGAAPKAYGALLLRLGTSRGVRAYPALALVRPSSLLERRLRMIVKGAAQKSGRGRALLPAAAAVLLVALACDTPAPTNPQATTGEASMVPRATVAPAAPVAPVPEGDIFAGFEMTDDVVIVLDGVEQSTLPRHLHASVIDRVEVTKGPDRRPARIAIFTKRADAEPLVFVDGERYFGEISELDPDDIERVEVLKGSEGGKIYITMKVVPRH